VRPTLVLRWGASGLAPLTPSPPPPPRPSPPPARRYFLHQLHKLKKTTGEILSCKEIFEKNPNTVKNYGLTIRYNSRSGTHNMYREYRDTRLAGAVDQMYADMAGRHRARFHSIHIVDTRVVQAGIRAAKRYNPELHGDVPPETVKRPLTKEFARSTRFPLAHRIQRASTKSKRSTYVAARPTTFFS
jgi:large subunit ribosomal protein L18Ae